MRDGLLFAIVTVSLSGCVIADMIHERQTATVNCRDLGYVGAVEDSGAWYCFRDKLIVPLTK